MPLAGYTAIFFTVILLMVTAYSFMGGLPLLVLPHDTPLDGRFVRRFFEVCYKVALVSAVGAAISYALWGRGGFALGAALMALLTVVLRRKVVPAMEGLGVKIQNNDASAIRAFRRVHTGALLVSLVQLTGLVWGVIRIAL
jgi:hypothetical protein